ncbi:hypothetical protein BVI1335_490008 [Burkholderia vietnamiensis]|nr:hypothetical protein BVI1335_490008 [Burkholderia vietnamiensis]
MRRRAACAHRGRHRHVVQPRGGEFAGVREAGRGAGRRAQPRAERGAGAEAAHLARERHGAGVRKHARPRIARGIGRLSPDRHVVGAARIRSVRAQAWRRVARDRLRRARDRPQERAAAAVAEPAGRRRAAGPRDARAARPHAHHARQVHRDRHAGACGAARARADRFRELHDRRADRAGQRAACVRLAGAGRVVRSPCACVGRESVDRRDGEVVAGLVRGARDRQCAGARRVLAGAGGAAHRDRCDRRRDRGREAFGVVLPVHADGRGAARRMLRRRRSRPDDVRSGEPHQCRRRGERRGGAARRPHARCGDARESGALPSPARSSRRDRRRVLLAGDGAAGFRAGAAPVSRRAGARLSAGRGPPQVHRDRCGRREPGRVHGLGEHEPQFRAVQRRKPARDSRRADRGDLSRGIPAALRALSRTCAVDRHETAWRRRAAPACTGARRELGAEVLRGGKPGTEGADRAGVGRADGLTRYVANPPRVIRRHAAPRSLREGKCVRLRARGARGTWLADAFARCQAAT